MCGACSSGKVREEACTGFSWGNLREKDHWRDPGVVGRIILRCIFKTLDGGMDWIELAQYTDRWRAPVDAVMNFQVP
jgi:hypothetical protein